MLHPVAGFPGIIGKLSTVLSYAFEKNVESFFEPCLDIVHTLLYCTAQAAKVRQCRGAWAWGAHTLPPRGGCCHS